MELELDLITAVLKIANSGKNAERQLLLGLQIAADSPYPLVLSVFVVNLLYHTIVTERKKGSLIITGALPMSVSKTEVKTLLGEAKGVIAFLSQKLRQAELSDKGMQCLLNMSISDLEAAEKICIKLDQMENAIS